MSLDHNPSYLLPGEDLPSYEQRRRAFRTLDARGFLPGTRKLRDQTPPENNIDPDEEDEIQDPDEGEEQGQVIATFEAPPDGCTYYLEQGEDGTVAVIVDLDDGGELNNHDAMYHHNLTGDNFLARMNKKNRAFHDRKTRDADVRQTILKHHPAPGRKLVLEGPDELGIYSLVVVSESTDLTGETPEGAQELPPDRRYNKDPLDVWVSGAGKERSVHELSQVTTGDAAHISVAKLRRMNAVNKQYWARS